ncbi:MAG: hypothetical protein AAF628_19960 [Planctomycetota bacterium]
MKRRPAPPHPDLVRRPQAPFGWLEAHLLHDRWLARLGPDATTVLVLLALAADRRGASFYSRARMADALGIDPDRVDHALHRLVELQIVAHRPWRPGGRDGVWQILPIETGSRQRLGRTASVAELLRSLGFAKTSDPVAG